MDVRKQILYRCHDEFKAAHTAEPTGLHCAARLEASERRSKCLGN